jgi:hypothetical protein
VLSHARARYQTLGRFCTFIKSATSVLHNFSVFFYRLNLFYYYYFVFSMSFCCIFNYFSMLIILRTVADFNTKLLLAVFAMFLITCNKNRIEWLYSISILIHWSLFNTFQEYYTVKYFTHIYPHFQASTQKKVWYL